MEECCGINLEQEMTIENLYCFIRASLQALQSTGGYGEADFVCPLCGKKAHIKRLKGELYIKFLIILICVHVSFANRS